MGYIIDTTTHVGYTSLYKLEHGHTFSTSGNKTSQVCLGESECSLVRNVCQHSIITPALHYIIKLFIAHSQKSLLFNVIVISL